MISYPKQSLFFVKLKMNPVLGVATAYWLATNRSNFDDQKFAIFTLDYMRRNLFYNYLMKKILQRSWDCVLAKFRISSFVTYRILFKIGTFRVFNIKFRLGKVQDVIDHRVLFPLFGFLLRLDSLDSFWKCTVSCCLCQCVQVWSMHGRVCNKQAATCAQAR